MLSFLITRIISKHPSRTPSVLRFRDSRQLYAPIYNFRWIMLHTDPFSCKSEFVWQTASIIYPLTCCSALYRCAMKVHVIVTVDMSNYGRHDCVFTYGFGVLYTDNMLYFVLPVIPKWLGKLYDMFGVNSTGNMSHFCISHLKINHILAKNTAVLLLVNTWNNNRLITIIIIKQRQGFIFCTFINSVVEISQTVF